MDTSRCVSTKCPRHVFSEVLSLCSFICRCTATAQGPHQRRDQWPEGFRRLCLCLWQAGRCAGTSLRVCLAQATALLCAWSVPLSLNRSSQVQPAPAVSEYSQISQADGSGHPSAVPPEGPGSSGSQSVRLGCCCTHSLPRHCLSGRPQSHSCQRAPDLTVPDATARPRLSRWRPRR